MTEYSAINAVNWSSLKNMSTSPLAYRWAVDHYGADDTLPRHDLRAIHVAVLTPELWESAVYVAESRRTVAMLAAHPGQEVITAATASTCQAIAETVRSHPIAGRILSARGWSERVIQWTDPATGLACKGRIDRVEWTPAPDPVRIWDLKTVGEVDADTIRWMARRQGWLGQAAHYRAGVRVATGRDCEVGLIVVQAKPPHDVGVYQLATVDLDAAESWRDSLLRRVAECTASGRWPGVCEEILPLSMSDEAEITIEEEEEEEP